MPSDPGTIVVERVGVMRVWRRADVPLAGVIAALHSNGDTLKRNTKSLTKRAGEYVVKSSEGPIIIQLVKHTFQRARYRRGWKAALHLAQHGVPAPRPVAHIEWGVAGIVWRHATVAEFIPGCRDVERFYDARVKAGLPIPERAAFLARLADAVNALVASGAYHSDLAGKNVLTRDGTAFYVIDLDAVALGGAYDEGREFALHVQLYDSFVDRCDDALLGPFLKRLSPARSETFGAWFARVKAAQQVRRARTVAAWEREGKG